MINATRQASSGGNWTVTWKFEDSSFETLKTLAEEQFYRSGERVFKEGDRPDGMYLVLSGTATIVRRAKTGEERIVGKVGESESFGELGVLIDEPRLATIIASSELQVLKITNYALELLQNTAPDMAFMMYRALAKTLAERLVQTQDMQRPD